MARSAAGWLAVGGVCWAALAGGCGGKQGGNEGGSAGADAVKETWATPTEQQTPEIPAFPDRCSAYRLEFSPRAPGAPQSHLTCPCAAGEYNLCDLESCVTAFDCDALCASFSNLGPTIFECAGECDLGADCGPLKCVALPGGHRGVFAAGKWCSEDADCAGDDTHCVAVTADGVRMCIAAASQCSAERNLVVAFGSVQRSGLRTLPLVHVALSDAWGVDAYAVGAYLPAKLGWVETYMAGVSYEN